MFEGDVKEENVLHTASDPSQARITMTYLNVVGPLFVTSLNTFTVAVSQYHGVEIFLWRDTDVAILPVCLSVCLSVSKRLLLSYFFSISF